MHSLKAAWILRGAVSPVDDDSCVGSVAGVGFNYRRLVYGNFAAGGDNLGAASEAASIS